MDPKTAVLVLYILGIPPSSFFTKSCYFFIKFSLRLTEGAADLVVDLGVPLGDWEVGEPPDLPFDAPTPATVDEQLLFGHHHLILAQHLTLLQATPVVIWVLQEDMCHGYRDLLFYTDSESVLR